MSANFYELLKYAATGIASPDMTYFDKMRASTLMGGAVKTLTGQPPLTFKADGTPLISWSMLGNGSQTGTPTPDNPVMPVFVGARTENLFDGSGIATSTNGVYVDSVGQMLYFHGKASGQGGRLNPLSNDITLDAGSYIIRSFGQKSIQLFLQKKGDSTKYYRFDNTTHLISLGEQTTFFISCGVIADTRYDETVGIVIVSGSTTPTSYVPYGWQIPLTNAGQTVPVYLGQTQTVRRIKKLVLTGKESYTETTGWKKENTSVYYTSAPNMYISYTAAFIASTHFEAVGRYVLQNADRNCISLGGNAVIFRIDTSIASDNTEFKSWVAQQYAAGTPVTIWYVLATPETAISNEPLAKIGDYADELSSEDAAVTIPTVKGNNTLTVETELQPSEMTITYKG